MHFSFAIAVVVATVCAVGGRSQGQMMPLPAFDSGVGRMAMYGGSGQMKGSSNKIGSNSFGKHKQGSNRFNSIANDVKKASHVPTQEPPNAVQTYDNDYLGGLYDYVKGWFSGNDTQVEEEKEVDMTLVEDRYVDVLAVIKEKTQSLISLLIKKFPALKVNNTDIDLVVNSTFNYLQRGEWNPVKECVNTIHAAIQEKLSQSVKEWEEFEESLDDTANKPTEAEIIKMQKMEQIISLAQEVGLLDDEHTVTASDDEDEDGARICMCL